MPIDYNKNVGLIEIDLSRRNMLGLLGMGAGGIMMFGGNTFYSSSFDKYFMPNELKKVYEIEGKFELTAFTLRDIETNSSNLIAHAETLNAERDEIIRNTPGFADLRNAYELEMEERRGGKIPFIIGGGLVMIVSMLLGAPRTHEEGENGNRDESSQNA